MKRDLTLREYYPWARKGIFPPSTPWKRFRFNHFLKIEQLAIDKNTTWLKNVYHKTPINGLIKDPIDYFVLPAKLNATWRAIILEKFPEYKPVGLSSLKNDLQNILIGLLPNEKSIPDYSFIRINQAKKVVLNNALIGEWALQIVDFETLRDDELYRIDHKSSEKSILQKIFSQHLGGQKWIAQSLQAPLISCPVQLGKSGGIAMGSIMGKSSFAEELHKQLQMCLPPEYRSFLPPQRIAKGAQLTLQSPINITFNVAEAFPSKNRVVSSTNGYSYLSIRNEDQLKNQFLGEYSYVATLIPAATNDYKELVQQILADYGRSEITSCYMGILEESDIDLIRLNKDITEDVMTSIVQQRDFTPSFDDSGGAITTRALRYLKKTWEITLTDLGFGNNIDDTILNTRAGNSWGNIQRVAQSIARSRNSPIVSEEDIKNALAILNSDLECFRQHDQFKFSKVIIMKSAEDKKEEVIRTILESQPLPEKDLWEATKSSSLFNDLIDFEKILDRMSKKGAIYFTAGPIWHLI